jgi:cell division protease FtsH
MDRRSTGLPGGRMGGPRTRFSLGYFLLAFLLLIFLQTLLARQSTDQIPYSEMKRRIADGQIQTARVGEQMIEVAPLDSIQEATGVRRWRSVRIEDDQLIPLLEAQGIEYEGVAQGWLGQAMVWLLPVGLILLFWVYMLRRMNPTQGVLTVGKSRADRRRGGNWASPSPMWRVSTRRSRRRSRSSSS